MTFISSMFGGKENDSAKRAAEEAARKQQELEAQRAAEIAKQKKDEENQETRNTARDRQRKIAAGATGWRDTILTGPLGDTSETQTQNKTLLGL